jgi:hypothetical protein
MFDFLEEQKFLSCGSVLIVVPSALSPAFAGTHYEEVT